MVFIVYAHEYIINEIISQIKKNINKNLIIFLFFLFEINIIILHWFDIPISVLYTVSIKKYIFLINFINLIENFLLEIV